jgi:hypothetical protein
MAGSSVFGPNDIGSIVRLWLTGGHELSAELVGISLAHIEVREVGSTGTWHIPTRSIVAWQFLARPGDAPEAA